MAASALFQRIIEKGTVIGWEADPETFQFSYVSPFAETLLGYPVERWLEEGFWQTIVHPDDVDYAVNYCKASTEKLESHEFEYRIVTADGRHIWLRDIVSVESHNGKPTRLYGIMVDISAEKEAMSALAQARDDALQADRAKTRFLANISHELRTPMNAIVGFTDFLLNRDTYAKQPIDLDEYLHLIKSSATHLGTLIDDLLELSRYEIGVGTLKFEPVDLAAVLTECGSMLHGLATSKDINLEIVLPSQPLIIEADNKGLKQVIINLMNNALKFTPPGGQVCAAVKQDETTDDGVKLTVTDTGIGMSRSVDAVYSSTTTGLSGTAKTQYRNENSGIGLGLSIVTSVLNLHGGNICFDGMEHGGTLATVWLPLRQTRVATNP